MIAAVPSPSSLVKMRRARAAYGKPRVGKRAGPLTDGLGAPLIRLLEVRSPFGPRTKPKVEFHKAVDLRAKNDPVIAAGDGYFERRMQRTFNPNGPMAPTGFGLYGIIRHFDGSTTLYGHLSFAVSGGPVKKGQRVGTSGATGTTDLHLHFEFIPAGPIPSSIVPQGLARVDPVPFIQILSVLEPNTPPPEIAVGGALQLRAVDTVGRSMAVDSDGKPITMENLKWTSQDSGIASVDDTGLVKGLRLGTVKITAHHTSSGRTADLSVRVTEVAKAYRASIGAGIHYIHNTYVGSNCNGPINIPSDFTVLSGPMTLNSGVPKVDLIKVGTQWVPASVKATGYTSLGEGQSNFVSTLSATGIVTTIETGSYTDNQPGHGTVSSTETIDLNTGQYTWSRTINESTSGSCPSSTVDTQHRTATLPISLSPILLRSITATEIP